MKKKNQPAKALKGLFVRGIAVKQLPHTLVHYSGCQHVQLVKLTNKSKIIQCNVNLTKKNYSLPDISEASFPHFHLHGLKFHLDPLFIIFTCGLIHVSNILFSVKTIHVVFFKFLLTPEFGQLIRFYSNRKITLRLIAS